MDSVDTIVIGAGVVGLAVARALASRSREVLVLERESAIGTQTSARNSGVIHAGLYYAPGSLKARFCVAGRDLLYDYAAKRGVAHRRTGKLVVATDPGQTAALHALKENAERNGVADIRLLTPAEARVIEPQVACAAALFVPVSGIVDQHELMLALLGDAEAAGATLVPRAPVMGGAVTADGIVLEIGGDVPTEIACRNLINAAGLAAQSVARRLRGLDPATIPGQVLAKGSYFSLTGKAPFSHLIYPLPVPGSSGLHAGFDIAGRARFGPDVEWVDRIDYRVDPAREKLFVDAIRRYWPTLPDGALQPDYAGVRPKLRHAGPHDSDFVVQTAREHRVTGLINLYGIESPGLTSSLALAEYVADQPAV
ncbi:MAG TPA: NAD(P)/FAD-dependent oxidoreductase [Stellaceae bacterium]|jgi:L-2-hydroxyglutarate oxidase LhgO